MPFRFRKIIKIGKGLKLNLSKSGISTSIGGKGLSLNLGKRGAKLTTGFPGTGISAETNLTPGLKLPRSKSTSHSNITDQQEVPPIADEPSISKPSRQFPWKLIGIVIGSIIFFCVACLACGLFTEIFFPTQPTATPTSTPIQTATTVPTSTVTFTPANTATASFTPEPTSTQTAYVTETLPPNCLQEYPTFCILPGERLSCDQLPSNFTVLPPDSLGYDGDGDGRGCEN